MGGQAAVGVEEDDLANAVRVELLHDRITIHVAAEYNAGDGQRFSVHVVDGVRR